MVHSHDPVRPFSWTLLNQKAIKETPDLLIISLEQGAANRKHLVMAGIALAWTVKDTTTIMWQDGKSAMEYQEEVP